MNLKLSDEQEFLQEAARGTLSRENYVEAARGALDGGELPDLWPLAKEAGWPGLLVSEDHGGAGLGPFDAMLVMGETGRVIAPVPLLGHLVGSWLLDRGGYDGLEALAHGERRAAYVAARPPSDLEPEWTVEAERGGARAPAPKLDGDKLSGTVHWVPDAPGADVIVVVDPAAGTAHVASGAEEVQAIDPTRRHGRASGDGEALDGDAAGAVDRALVAVSAELVGVCRRALDMTVEYVKERKQFGVPVGTFQAVHHGAAQMLIDTEGGRSATFYAAWAADAAPERLPMAAAMAKAWTSDAGRSVTGSAIQLHGGIGFTWEADVHWLYKRAQLDSALLGAAGVHRARIAALAGRDRAGAAA